MPPPPPARSARTPACDRSVVRWRIPCQVEGGTARGPSRFSSICQPRSTVATNDGYAVGGVSCALRRNVPVVSCPFAAAMPTQYLVPPASAFQYTPASLLSRYITFAFCVPSKSLAGVLQSPLLPTSFSSTLSWSDAQPAAVGSKPPVSSMATL